jgi:glycosyltransferase involved in cell wall biosynthesis
MNSILYIVIPCFNEQDALSSTAAVLLEKCKRLADSRRIAPSSKIVFIDDGSSDRTWDMIIELHLKNSMFSGIKLSRNCGHQNALLAGLLSARIHANMVISMDCDMQDDINAIDLFIEKYERDCDIVYGVRSKRRADTFFKRTSAELFYRLMRLMGAEIIFNYADYRLMTRRALDGLAEFSEVNLFLRGFVPMVGYQSDFVFYERHERIAGESKYPLGRMLALAMESVTSLSIRPIRLIGILGLLIFS